MLHLWRLEFWDGSYSFGKWVQPWFTVSHYSNSENYNDFKKYLCSSFTDRLQCDHHSTMTLYPSTCPTRKHRTDSDLANMDTKVPCLLLFKKKKTLKRTQLFAMWTEHCLQSSANFPYLGRLLRVLLSRMERVVPNQESVNHCRVRAGALENFRLNLRHFIQKVSSAFVWHRNTRCSSKRTTACYKHNNFSEAARAQADLEWTKFCKISRPTNKQCQTIFVS
jgi:hypothetical protein